MPTSTRERIIDTCSSLFMQRGHVASGLKQIAAKSEATIGSIYHFFPGGKDELAAETLKASGAAYQALVESVFDAEADIVAGVAACYRGAAEVLRASDYADAYPIATVALEVASSDEQLRVVTATIFEQWLESAAVRLRAAGIKPKRTRELAIMLIAALEGGFLLCRAAKDTAPLEAIGKSMVQLVKAELTDAG